MRKLHLIVVAAASLALVADCSGQPTDEASSSPSSQGNASVRSSR